LKIKVKAVLKIHDNDFKRLRARARANQILLRISEVDERQFKMTFSGEKVDVMKTIVWLLKEPRLSQIDRLEFNTVVAKQP
jgi:hypothetical protein